MAEATAIAHFRDASTARGVRLGYDHTGLHFNLSFTVPPPRALARRAVRRVQVIKNRLLRFILYVSAIIIFMREVQCPRTELYARI